MNKFFHIASSVSSSASAVLNPASMFDDIKICNAVGVYKNGGGNDEDKKGIFDDENAFLRGLKPNTEKSILVDNEFIIYPNPANNQINIRYKNNDDTKLQIVNMLGVVVKEIYLSKELQQVSLLFNDLVTGVYCYRQIQGKVVQSTGKLIIVN